jgi:hypothetical protein
MCPAFCRYRYPILWLCAALSMRILLLRLWLNALLLSHPSPPVKDVTLLYIATWRSSPNAGLKLTSGPFNQIIQVQNGSDEARWRVRCQHRPQIFRRFPAASYAMILKIFTLQPAMVYRNIKDSFPKAASKDSLRTNVPKKF